MLEIILLLYVIEFQILRHTGNPEKSLTLQIKDSVAWSGEATVTFKFKKVL